MKSDKDLFDLFRENEHKLTETPSPRAWDRLEQRLDSDTQKHQVSYYRQIAVAASMVALLAVAFVLATYLQPNNHNMAMNNTVLLEDLGGYEDSEEGAYKAVEFIRKHKSRLANPVEEGTNDKKLKAVVME